MAGCPSANDAEAFGRFVVRSRMLSLFLSTLSCGAAIAAHQAEGHGSLWIVAAVSAGVSIPYNLLLMSSPSPVPAPSNLSSRRPVTFADPPASTLGAEDGGLEDGIQSPSAFAGHPGFHSADLDALDDLGMAKRRSPQQPAQARRLMYAKSGILVNPVDLSRSWSRKFWFQAALSLTVFGGMVSILATRKSSMTAGGGYAPF